MPRAQAAKAKVSQVDVDLTPMIDVTFQLIIFFMLVINFADLDRAEVIRLPVADMARATDKPPEERITLNIDKDGDVIWTGDTFFKKSNYAGLDRQLKLQADLIAQYMKQADKDPSQSLWTTVLVRGDLRAKCGDVQKIMAKCRQYKLTKFALRAMAKQQD